MDLILPLRLKGYRFPRSVIAYAVWSYYRFNLSFRDVEDLLAERGVTVSYETIRAWVVRFGPQIAAQIRRDRPPAGDKWHIDEMVITIGGEPHWLWRAVNNRGDVLEILVQKLRNARAARRFLRELMRRWGQPRVVVTDKLRSYDVAFRTDCRSADRRSHKRLNNRIENSRRHTRRSERSWAGSNPPVRRKDFSPPTIRSPSCSARNATVSPPDRSAALEPMHFRSGPIMPRISPPD